MRVRLDFGSHAVELEGATFDAARNVAHGCNPRSGRSVTVPLEGLERQTLLRDSDGREVTGTRGARRQQRAIRAKARRQHSAR